ncbi:hypothetical protein K1719_045989 [Acacia pycnantha]|nr:hypothetical protein K1719_045989 [Acacia pycnantha]
MKFKALASLLQHEVLYIEILTSSRKQYNPLRCVVTNQITLPNSNTFNRELFSLTIHFIRPSYVILIYKLRLRKGIGWR